MYCELVNCCSKLFFLITIINLVLEPRRLGTQLEMQAEYDRLGPQNGNYKDTNKWK